MHLMPHVSCLRLRHSTYLPQRVVCPIRIDSKEAHQMMEETQPAIAYPVTTWRLHDITKLPMCWLFVEYDRDDEFIPFTYDGTKYRVYEGNQTRRLSVVEQVAVYGR